MLAPAAINILVERLSPMAAPARPVTESDLWLWSSISRFAFPEGDLRPSPFTFSLNDSEATRAFALDVYRNDVEMDPALFDGGVPPRPSLNSVIKYAVTTRFLQLEGQRNVDAAAPGLAPASEAKRLRAAGARLLDLAAKPEAILDKFGNDWPDLMIPQTPAPTIGKRALSWH